MAWEEILKGTMYTTTIVSGISGTIGYISRQRRIVKEKDYDTRQRRIWEVNRLMSSQGFRDYLRRREEFRFKLIEKYPAADPMHISILVKDALGEFDPKDYY